MKFPLFCALVPSLLPAALTTLSSRAEAHCPGGVTSLRLRVVADALLVVPVTINRVGPFDFLVDTGTQPNLIDPSLASSLDLKSQGPVGLITASTFLSGSVATVTSLEAGGYTLKNPAVVVEDLGALQAADPHIRGVLGENFLAYFDVLIDYDHKLLCLDRSKAMEGELRGERIPLVPPKHPEDELPFLDRLVVSVNLSDSGTRDILLQLDSGSTGPILYSGNPKLEKVLLKKARIQGPEVGQARRAFAVLPPQDMQIGTRSVRDIPFATPVRAATNVPDREEDGILATVLFDRIYINHRDRYVIFDPR
jgi:hypothetical protein